MISISHTNRRFSPSRVCVFMKRTWLASEGFSCCVARETRQEIVAHIRWQEPGCRCFAPKPLGWHGCIPMGNTPEWKLCAQLKLQEFSTVFSVRVMQYATRCRQRMLVNKTRIGEKCCSEPESRYRYVAFCFCSGLCCQALRWDVMTAAGQNFPVVGGLFHAQHPYIWEFKKKSYLDLQGTTTMVIQ